MLLRKSINFIIISNKLCNLPITQTYLKCRVPMLSYCSPHEFIFKNTYCQEFPSKETKNTAEDSDFKGSQFDDAESSENSSQRNECRDKKKEEELQANILKASLPFVNKCGWNAEAISKGAETLGYSGMIHGMFPNGGTDIVNFFYAQCNSELESILKQLAKERDEQEKKENATHFLRKAVELRLRMNIDYIDVWPQALALHMSPSNASNALHNIGTLMDIIWYYAGDRSTDFNWYTKRGVLATIYKSTELCMLQDQSNDFQDTWKFLDRRLQEVRTFAKCMRQAEDVSKDIGSVSQVGLITAMNILGLNIKSR